MDVPLGAGWRQLITAWTLGETKPLGIELGKASVCDAFGRTTQTQGTKDLQLSYFPTYISITEPSADFAKAVEAAKAKPQLALQASRN